MEYRQIIYPFEGGVSIIDIDSYRPPHTARPINSNVKISRNLKDLTARI